MLFVITGNSYGQDSLVHSKIQTIAVNFAISGQPLTAYKMLPGFIKDYLDSVNSVDSDPVVPGDVNPTLIVGREQ